MARRTSHKEIDAGGVEVLPEADRLEGFAHPRETQRVFGHVHAERTLLGAFQSQRLHHAWLIGGAAGIGKATLAYRFARFLLAEPLERDAFAASLDVAADCVAQRQVLAMSHPGLMVIRRPFDTKAKRFTASIPVDEVRKLRGFLSHRGGAEAWRVVIFDSADELNVNAANALLKSLEEPPPRTVFLLISSQPGRLLTTIRSRCRRLDLSVLTTEQAVGAMRQAMQHAGRDAPDDARLMQLAELSGGSVRRGLSFEALGGIELAEKVDAVLASLPKVNWSEVHRLADDLAPQAAAERFEVFFEFVLDRVARFVRCSASTPDVTNRAESGGGDPQAKVAIARRLIPEGQLASWAGLWETLARAKADAATLNLDRKALILDIAGRLQAAAAASR